jgi:dihydrofolate reductase/thymidylate synthase
MFFNIVVCTDNNYGIGKNNNIPWKYSKDIEYFKNLTIGNNTTLQLEQLNVVIMGNNTYNSIPLSFKPLKDRINMILSKSVDSTNMLLLEDIEYIKNNPIYFSNINHLLLYIDKIKKNINECFVIGGGQIYDLFLDLKLIRHIYLTKINDISSPSSIHTLNNKQSTYNCDKFFNFENYKKQFQLKNTDYIIDTDKISHKTNTLTVNTYSYINKEENKFIKTVNKILDKGVYNIDRSKVGTLSIFGKSFTYDIRNYRLPLFTHRKIFLRGIIEELIFFISGKSDTKVLEEKKVNIWKGHTSRDFLNSRGLTNLKEGDMGAGYGHQLRHFSAEYENAETDYTGKGFDQLQYIIDQIKHNPTSRRIVFSYWNPSAFDKTSLLPCHILYQFYVNTETSELSCSFYQRSNDYILANCFNICSATILVFMLCKICNLKPGKVIHTIGDIHIYSSQLDVAKEIVQNTPFNFPLLFIEDPKDEIKKIEDFKSEHFKLLFYNSHKKYNIPMAI